MRATLEDVRRALRLPDFDVQTEHARMFPETRNVPTAAADRVNAPPKQAGVLVLLFDRDDGDGLRVVLTRRADSLRGHRGQISFPGGKRDPEDNSFTDCALRETCEELGLCGAEITTLGTLSQIYIPPSHFEVHPTVGHFDGVPDYVPNPAEVAEVFDFPLRDLLDDAFVDASDYDFSGTPVRVPFFNVQGHQVWGATAIMLSELKGRLRAVLT